MEQLTKYALAVTASVIVWFMADRYFFEIPVIDGLNELENAINVSIFTLLFVLLAAFPENPPNAASNKSQITVSTACGTLAIASFGVSLSIDTMRSFFVGNVIDVLFLSLLFIVPLVILRKSGKPRMKVGLCLAGVLLVELILIISAINEIWPCAIGCGAVLLTAYAAARKWPDYFLVNPTKA